MGLRDFALQGGVPSRAGPTEARSRKLARPREAAPPGLGRYPVHQFNPRFGGDSYFNTTTPFSRAVVACLTYAVVFYPPLNFVKCPCDSNLALGFPQFSG